MTALHESLQLDEENNAHQHPSAIRLTSCEDEGKDPIYFQRYARNPREVSGRFNKGSRYGSSRPSARTEKVSKEAFEEARRRKECVRCGKSLAPGNRCEHGSIARNTHIRFMNKDNPVHIVRDLVLELEGGLANEVGSEALEASKVHFAEEELAAEFDVAMQQETPEDEDDTLIDRLDEEIATNLVSAATRGGADFQ